MSTQTFNISMPEKLVKQIDAQTKAQGGSRSDFIRQAVRKQLTTLERWNNLTSRTRSLYKGKQLSESEVANIVRAERSKD
jgi:metal-responsive CopG/Arc/MetJ family transcriptional regulator